MQNLKIGLYDTSKQGGDPLGGFLALLLYLLPVPQHPRSPGSSQRGSSCPTLSHLLGEAQPWEPKELPLNAKKEGLTLAGPFALEVHEFKKKKKKGQESTVSSSWEAQFPRLGLLGGWGKLELLVRVVLLTLSWFSTCPSLSAQMGGRQKVV